MLINGKDYKYNEVKVIIGGIEIEVIPMTYKEDKVKEENFIFKILVFLGLNQK
jgi:hypothetical protein